MRIISRRVCLALLAACGLWAPTGSRPSLATDTQVSLKLRLEKDLKARRPVEFEFITRVIVLVDQGILPRGEVERLYLWARRQPERPFQHFQFALEQRAKKLGIVI